MIIILQKTKKRTAKTLTAILLGGFLMGSIQTYAQETGQETGQETAYGTEPIIPIIETTILIDDYEDYGGYEDYAYEPYEPSHVMIGADTMRTLFPVTVEELDFGNTRRIVRTYELQPGESAHDIRTGSFEREGFYFEISEITRNRMSYMSRRDFTKVVEIETSTSSANAVMAELSEFMEYLSYDGYSGILRLDLASVRTEVGGIRQEGFTGTQRQVFPNLSNPDVSLIPSTITVNNRQYSLADVSWSGGMENTVDFARVASTFTANATFTRQGVRNITLGYITTAEFSGTLSRINSGDTTYSATFIGTPITAPEMTAEELEAYLYWLQNQLDYLNGGGQNGGGQNGNGQNAVNGGQREPREPFSINPMALITGLLLLALAGGGFWFFFIRGNVEVQNLQQGSDGQDKYVKIGRAMLNKKNLIVDLSPFSDSAKSSAFKIVMNGFVAKGFNGKNITINYGSNTFQHEVVYEKGMKGYSLEIEF